MVVGICACCLSFVVCRCCRCCRCCRLSLLSFVVCRLSLLSFVVCQQAARVRVPGRSPFSQLILHETDKSKVVSKTKTFSFKGQTNERINQTNSITNYPPRSSESKTSCEFLLVETNIYLHTQRAQQNFAKRCFKFCCLTKLFRQTFVSPFV